MSANKMKSHLLLLSMLLISTTIVNANIFKERQEYEAANAGLKSALDLGYPDTNKILFMLADEEYIPLEKYFRQLEARYQDNVNYESLLFKSYWVFERDDNNLLRQLNEWVSKRGTSVAYCARGMYYVNKGYKARGSAYIQETPESKIEKMEMFHRRAKNDLEKSIKLDPKNMPAYHGLIDILRASGTDVEKKAVYEEATRQDKKTYYVRYIYLRSLTPRWGGSYSKMKSVIENFIQYAPLNPRLWSLRGTIDFEKGYTYMLDKNYDMAILYYDKALSYSDRTEWLYYRSECYERTKQYKLELKDLKRYLLYKPHQQQIIQKVSALKHIVTEQSEKGYRHY